MCKSTSINSFVYLIDFVRTVSGWLYAVRTNNASVTTQTIRFIGSPRLFFKGKFATKQTRLCISLVYFINCLISCLFRSLNASLWEETIAYGSAVGSINCFALLTAFAAS